MNKAYKDHDTLQELYHGKGMSQKEMADELNTSSPTISRWMDKLGVKSQDVGMGAGSVDLGSDTLQEMYWDHGMTQQEIADEIGCGKSTVVRKMEKFNISTRSIGDYLDEQIKSINTNTKGYEVINHKGTNIKHHRLMMVAEHGFDSVNNKSVHHRNGLKWGNWIGNLKLMTNSEHMKLHREIDEYPEGFSED